MTVIVKYIVVRNGVEKMTFATKKEADIHDKMLDIADRLYEFIEKEDLGLDETKMEDISLAFARDRDKIIPILRGTKPVKPKTVLKKSKPEVTSIVSKEAKTKASPNKKVASSKRMS